VRGTHVVAGTWADSAQSFVVPRVVAKSADNQFWKLLNLPVKHFGGHSRVHAPCSQNPFEFARVIDKLRILLSHLLKSQSDGPFTRLHFTQQLNQ